MRRAPSQDSFAHPEEPRIDRREFLRRSSGALAAGTLVGAGAVDAPRAIAATAPTPERPKERRLLFNWDGSMIHTFAQTLLPDAEKPLTREQFVNFVFTPIAGTPVDALFFSFGSGNVAEYDSGVLEWPGEADGFKFPESRAWHGGAEVDPKFQYLNPKSLADAGHNPPAVIVDECHQRGLEAFVSLRMNDCHDGQHPRGARPNPELATFKRQNPDLLVEDLDLWSALNFKEPRVRALKLRVVKEFFERWDFDGIELDWLRHTLNFPRGTERENGKYLTQFMRDARAALNDLAKNRGRSIELAVRVPERLEWCREGGFEVDTWVREGLVDLLILGQGMTEAPGVDDFRSIDGGRDLPIYPSLYMYGNGYQVSPEEVVRGSAANLWYDGADGLYMFNWFCHGPWRRDLLTQIATAESLRRGRRHHTAVHRVEPARGDPGRDSVRYNTAVKDAPVPFFLNEVRREREIDLLFGGEAVGTAQSAELWLAVDHLLTGDRVRIDLNEVKVGEIEIGASGRAETVGFKLSVPDGSGLLGLKLPNKLDMAFQALRIPVPAALLSRDRNRVRIRLEKRALGAEFPLRVTRIELSVG